MKKVKVYIPHQVGGYDVYESPASSVEKLIGGHKLIDHKIVGFSTEVEPGAVSTGGAKPLPDKAVVAVFHPSLWGTRLVQVDGEVVSKTCTVFGETIEANVPGRASTVDARRFKAKLTPGRFYLVVVLDRVDIQDERTGIEPVYEYGDSHGGKYVGIWRPTQNEWKLKLDTWGYKHRDKRTYVIKGEGLSWFDVSDEAELQSMPTI
jgi:hypothetical protein